MTKNVCILGKLTLYLSKLQQYLYTALLVQRHRTVHSDIKKIHVCQQAGRQMKLVGWTCYIVVLSSACTYREAFITQTEGLKCCLIVEIHLRERNKSVIEVCLLVCTVVC